MLSQGAKLVLREDSELPGAKVTPEIRRGTWLFPVGRGSCNSQTFHRYELILPKLRNDALTYKLAVNLSGGTLLYFKIFDYWACLVVVFLYIAIAFSRMTRVIYPDFVWVDGA